MWPNVHKINIFRKKKKDKKKRTKEQNNEKRNRSKATKGSSEINNNDDDTDKFQKADEKNEFGIDDVIMNIHRNHQQNPTENDNNNNKNIPSATDVQDGSKNLNNNNEEEAENEPRGFISRRDIINQEENGYPIFRSMSQDEDMNPNVNDLGENNDTDIDFNLMGMYRRGLEVQLKKMHHVSDTVYLQIEDDIKNGMSQQEIFKHYQIDFIPDVSSFKLIPPPSIIDIEQYEKMERGQGIKNNMTPSPNIKIMRNNNNNNGIKQREDIKMMEKKMNANTNSKIAFKNFYALTKMQQKYLGPNGELKEENEEKGGADKEHIDGWSNGDKNDVDGDNDPEQEIYDDEDVQKNKNEEEEGGENKPWGNRTDGNNNMLDEEDVYNMNALRGIQSSTPIDILNVILNDNKLPQWLYEGDTILDLNCGIGDNLIYLLSNFTTIRGICIVGTNKIKYKYAKLNIDRYGLMDRIEIVNKDLYSPYIKSLFNKSDIIYIDWYNCDEEYLNNYFINNLMNNHYIRSAKHGRVILSYNKLLFDEDIFQASYTLHFASGWNLNHIQNKPLIHDVSMYMYSIPFYLSKLSNFYVRNYQVFYGYHPIFSGLEFDFDPTQFESALDNDTEHQNDNIPHCHDVSHDYHHNVHQCDDQHNMATMTPKPNGKTSGLHDDDVGDDINSDYTQCHSSSAGNVERIHVLQYNDNNYVHLNNAIFRKISSLTMDDINGGNDNNGNNNRYNNDYYNDDDEAAIFEIISSGLNVNEIGEYGEIQRIWTMISSQLLYQSFINGIQNIIKNDVENENSQVLLRILNSINDRHKEKEQRQQQQQENIKEGEEEKEITSNNNDDDIGIDDDWQYLEFNIFNLHQIDSCSLYEYIYDEWKLELNLLLNEFSQLFFYQSVKDSTDLKLQSLLQKCPQIQSN